MRLRWDQLKSRVEGPAAERPLTTYLEEPPADVSDGLEVSRRAFGLIAAEAAERGAQTALVLMPARFQTDDADYGRLRTTVSASGGVVAFKCVAAVGGGCGADYGRCLGRRGFG